MEKNNYFFQPSGVNTTSKNVGTYLIQADRSEAEKDANAEYLKKCSQEKDEDIHDRKWGRRWNKFIWIGGAFVLGIIIGMVVGSLF